MLGNMISPEEYCREFQGNKCNLKVPIPCNRCGTDLFNKLYWTNGIEKICWECEKSNENTR